MNAFEEKLFSICLIVRKECSSGDSLRFESEEFFSVSLEFLKGFKKRKFISNQQWQVNLRSPKKTEMFLRSK